MWRIILNAISLFLNPDLAMIQFSYLDYNLFSVLLIVMVWTNLSAIITFSLTGFLDKKLIKRKEWRIKLAKLRWVRRIRKSIKGGQKKFLGWLLKQEKIIIFLVLLIPGVPMVKSIAIIAARISMSKNALFLILIANRLRVLLMIHFIYSI